MEMKRYFYVGIETEDAWTIHRCVDTKEVGNMVRGNAPIAYPLPANDPKVRHAKRCGYFPVEEGVDERDKVAHKKRARRKNS